jgi:hypothetical protein
MVITGKFPGTSGTPSSLIGKCSDENTLAVMERAIGLIRAELEATLATTKRLELLVKRLKNREG